MQTCSDKGLRDLLLTHALNEPSGNQSEVQEHLTQSGLSHESLQAAGWVPISCHMCCTLLHQLNEPWPWPRSLTTTRNMHTLMHVAVVVVNERGHIWIRGMLNRKAVRWQTRSVCLSYNCTSCPHFWCNFLDVYIANVWRLTNLDPVKQDYASRVAYCIPILANATMCYDVSIQQTPEMQTEADSICLLCLELNGFCVDGTCTCLSHLCFAQPGQASRRGAKFLSASYERHL